MYNCGLCARYACFPKYSNPNRFAPPSLALPIFFGVLKWLPDLPLVIEVILGVLLLDFIGAYLAHYTEHKIKPLWMIHLVHHSDHKVDTTTANRHHPLESIIRFSFTLFGVFIIGTSMGIVMLYQSLSLISTQFTHANIKLPRKIDKVISYFLVSPDMHKIHHHFLLPHLWLYHF